MKFVFIIRLSGGKVKGHFPQKLPRSALGKTHKKRRKLTLAAKGTLPSLCAYFTPLDAVRQGLIPRK